MKKRFLQILCVLTVLAVTSVGCSSKPPAAATPTSPPVGSQASTTSSPAAAVVAKLSHSSAPGSAYDVGANKFKELVEAKTNGSVIIEVYPSGQLGGDRDALEGERMGTVDISLPGTSMLSQYEPKVGVFNLPFLFQNREDAYKVLDGEVGAEVYAAAQNQGLRVLTTFESGFRQVATISKPVQKLADLKGVKVRVPDGDLYVKSWKAMGVNPTVLGWNELFTALQTGVVEGEEAPITSFDSAGFSEVVKHFSYINYMYDPVVVICSEQFWGKLSAEQQAAVQQAAYEARDFQRAYVLEQEQVLEKKLQEEGVTFYFPELSEFQAAMQPVYQEYEDQETLSRVLSVLGR